MSDASLAKIAYVICAWGGMRRNMDQNYKNCSTTFIARHLERLDRLKHSLSKVIIVWPYAKKEKDIYARFLSERFTQFKSAPLVVLFHRNWAGSYGSWLHAYDAFGDTFTHYIVMEDDYCPSIDHFDTELLELMNATPNCGAVFGCLCEWGGKKFASIANGLISYDAFKLASPRMREVCNSIYHEGLRGIYEACYQVEWTNAILKAGMDIIDVGSKFSLKFLDGKKTKIFHDSNERMIMESI